jgi:DNA invertase Pin-like site-specific DNA recombinase
MRKAFSYARFSTAEQQDGRAIARQEAAVKSYCDRHGLTLDERTFTDLGVSAYHGANATHGELSVFLDMLRDGRIPAGATLVAENLDRLTRNADLEAATSLITSIVKAGVDVATTSPETLYTLKNIYRTATWLPLQIHLSLAAEESTKKSMRISDARAAERDRARVPGTEKVTKLGPAWLKITADRKGWVVLEDKAALVRRMFELALDGLGTRKIAGILAEECPEGLTGRGWQPPYINTLLRSRTVLGEFQPHVGRGAKKGRGSTRKPSGDPIPGYYPAIVSEADFLRVQDALAGRRYLTCGGRTTGTPNLFNGFLFDALDGQTLTVNSAHGRRVLVSSGALRKAPGSSFRSFPADVFETEVLSRLAELKPEDVLGKPSAKEDKVAVLSGLLTAINRKMDTVRARAAAEEDVSVFLDLLADLDRQRAGLIAELEKAKAEVASHQGDNLGDFVSLATLLREAGDDERDGLRQKLRAALRRLVKDMYAVVVRRDSRTKLCVVQVWMKKEENRHRDYLILYRSPRGNFGGRDEGYQVSRSFAAAAADGELDLRRREHAEQLAAELASLDVSGGDAAEPAE